MNIILTGFMGTGKTTIGKILSQIMSMRFCDVDSLIEKEQAMPIREIFSKFGEQAFRRIESETIEKIAQVDNTIISCGGGAVLNLKNIENLRRNGKIVNLYAEPDTIYSRVKGDLNRPVLKGSDPSIEEIKVLLENRSKFYANCDISIDTSKISPQEAADKIKEAANENYHYGLRP
ncbi:MAG: shikimate kinase [Elusimicrobiota bacterium]|jgi:shikimate kinase|nr:shikimate kinase [Elusimicrobiota bacterium]